MHSHSIYSPFRFNISISEKGYATKDSAVSSLPCYADIEKKVVNPDCCHFSIQSVTISELADYISKGHTTCAIYRCSKPFTASFKKEDNFAYTHTLFFDLDDANCTMDELLDSVPYAPSIAYRSFNDGVNGNRFRFVYVFDDYIHLWNFDYVYGKVAALCNMPSSLDKRNAVQCYFGTNKPDVRVTNKVYTLDEMGIDLPSTREPGIVYIKQYPVRFHSELIPSKNNHYYLYPDEYYEVMHRYCYNKEEGKPMVMKFRDGEHRRNKLWRTGQVLIKLNPGISLKILTDALSYEVKNFYDNSDGIIDVTAIAENVYQNWDKKKILQMTDFPSYKKKSFKINSVYWKSVMSKGDGHYNPAIAVAECRKEIMVDNIKQNYDPNFSVKDNVKNMNEFFPISESTLYKYLKDERLVSQIPTRLNIQPTVDNIFIRLGKDDTIHYADLAEYYGCSVPTIKRNMKDVLWRGYVSNTGSNRNPIWVVNYLPNSIEEFVHLALDGENIDESDGMGIFNLREQDGFWMQNLGLDC